MNRRVKIVRRAMGWVSSAHSAVKAVHHDPNAGAFDTLAAFAVCNVLFSMHTWLFAVAYAWQDAEIAKRAAASVHPASEA